jgi:16S rRNA (cytosine967-C5)-methyltransferase
MAELMKNKGTILAVDISDKRLPFLQTNCIRLGIKNITSLTSDVLSMGNEFENKFDGVFLDSPCSGTGVMGRRSDLRWKKSPDDIKRLSLLQTDLLKKASTFVRPGGYMVYSVCSIEAEEGEDVIKKFLLENNDFLLEDISHYSDKNDASETGLLIFPPLHQTEGFFISRLRRKNL